MNDNTTFILPGELAAEVRGRYRRLVLNEVQALQLVLHSEAVPYLQLMDAVRLLDLNETTMGMISTGTLRLFTIPTQKAIEHMAQVNLDDSSDETRPLSLLRRTRPKE